MLIKKLILHNLGRFVRLKLDLAPTPDNPSRITVIVGNNGSGKTSILSALSIGLSWFVARLRKNDGSGYSIPEEAILNAAASAAIEIEVFDDTTTSLDVKQEVNYLYKWILSSTREGRQPEYENEISSATKLAHRYGFLYNTNQNTCLPLIAYYPAERTVLDVPLEIDGNRIFQPVDGYDNSFNQGINFVQFFQWFRDREDIENEKGISEDVLEKLKEFAGTDHQIREVLLKLKSNAQDPQLNAVRNAVSQLMPGFTHLRVHRKPGLYMSVEKDGQELNILQLSQGEKSLIALVGDIARRLAMLNPGMENPLLGAGIVLIDEIDLHLHPSWQRNIVANLAAAFPNCQFILTTHSPLVISDYKDVLVYSLNDGQVIQVPSQYGQDANSVLLDVMDTHVRNAEIAKKLNDLLDFIQDKNLFQAKKLIQELKEELPASNLELIKANLLLRKQELASEKNH